MTMQERENLMTSQYGEVCTRTTAAKILSKSPQTIKVMLDDGRLDYACGGSPVDVRSIARYIAQPKQEDFRVRNIKAGRKWSV